MEINGIEIKPGMVITTTTAIFITFPTKVGMAFMDIDSGDWTPSVPRNITVIQDISKGERITTGAVLWKKPEEVVITIDQIAEKFGYSAEQIKIKK